MAREVSLVIVLVLGMHDCGQTPARFPDASQPQPAGYHGPAFSLSQDYPRELPPPEAYPWATIDFQTRPLDYLQAVLDYSLAGNAGGGVPPEHEFRVEFNTVRQWYHVPNIDREAIHGLTLEPTVSAGTLGPQQQTAAHTWALAMYNARGAYVLGRAWANPNAPSDEGVVFPDGTVAIKLLFTTATEQEAAYLKGGIAWKANIPLTAPVITDVKLLQFDVAVKDSRAAPWSGWVFGTFVYDGNRPAAAPWRRLMPVGIMWGNDPQVTPQLASTGTPLTQTFINPAIDPAIPVRGRGVGGRLNGIVDNPSSSCIDCHRNANRNGRNLDFAMQLGDSFWNFDHRQAPGSPTNVRLLRSGTAR